MSGNVGVVSAGASAAAAALMTSGQSCGAGNGTFVVGDSRGAVMPGSSSVISPKSTGATVHHHGPPVDPPRESSFAHLCSQLQQSASLQAPANIMPERPHLSSDLSVDVADTQARKRIKLEPSYDISLMSATSPSSFCRTLYINSRENELLELRSSYQEHLMELFFLENGGNLMDYIAWSKRPNIHLSNLLQSASLDSTDDTRPEDKVCHFMHFISL